MLKDHSTSDMQKQKQQQPCFMSSLGKAEKHHFITTKKACRGNSEQILSVV